MLNRFRFSACSTVVSACFLAACSTSDNTITQNYQIERALVENSNFDCPYRYITDSVGQQITLLEDSDEIIALLRKNCPSLASYFAENDGGFVFASNTLDDSLTLPSDERTNENVRNTRSPDKDSSKPRNDPQKPRGDKPGTQEPSGEEPNGGVPNDPGNPGRPAANTNGSQDRGTLNRSLTRSNS